MFLKLVPDNRFDKLKFLAQNSTPNIPKN